MLQQLNRNFDTKSTNTLWLPLLFTLCIALWDVSLFNSAGLFIEFLFFFIKLINTDQHALVGKFIPQELGVSLKCAEVQLPGSSKLYGTDRLDRLGPMKGKQCTNHIIKLKLTESL